MSDLIDRQSAIDELNKLDVSDGVGIVVHRYMVSLLRY